MVSDALLKRSFPHCEDPAGWAAALSPALERYQINNSNRICSFLAQVGHESGEFNRMEESLNYSMQRLRAVWPARFLSDAEALPYAHKPEALANRVYANRLGNGDKRSGDGYRYRGRGLIQLTGRSNYTAASEALGLDLVADPDLLLQKPAAAMSAAWFWNRRGLNALADDETDDNDLEDFAKITRLINGGEIGVEQRFGLFKAVIGQYA